MILTAILVVITYFLPIFIYIALEIRRNQIYRFLGESYSFKDYILEVLIDALRRSQFLVSDLIQDLTFPVLHFVNLEDDPPWQIMLVLGQQCLLHLITNLATLVYFLPLEGLGQLLLALRNNHWQSSPRSSPHLHS